MPASATAGCHALSSAPVVMGCRNQFHSRSTSASYRSSLQNSSAVDARRPAASFGPHPLYTPPPHTQSLFFSHASLLLDFKHTDGNGVAAASAAFAAAVVIDMAMAATAATTAAMCRPRAIVLKNQ